MARCRSFSLTWSSSMQSSEQFSLAMYLIHQKVMGVDPPQTLSAEMVPPSMRNGSASTPTATGEDRVGVTVRC